MFKRVIKRKLQKIKKGKLPHHIAFIMDGNGRWAKRRGLPRKVGHYEGGRALVRILQLSHKLGIQAITVFAFSTENWKRPKEEVDYLMSLPSQYIDQYLPRIKEENIRMNFIGDITELPQQMQNDIKRATEETRGNTGLIFTIALNYGAQHEVLSATMKIAQEIETKQITHDEINLDYFKSKLMTHDLPDVDLLIRTSGELRVSNFLLWQIAYSELYFTKKCWPDFKEIEMLKALKNFQKRHRRYGGLKNL